MKVKIGKIREVKNLGKQGSRTQKILIAGSAGYVGSNLIQYYSLDKTFDLYGISRSKNKSKLLKKNYMGDIRNNKFLKSIEEKFDVVINCAAKTEHFGQKHLFYQDNVETLNSLLINLEGRYKTFIHISSEAVFLNGKLPLLNEKSTLPKKNISDYAWSKNLAEQAIEKFKSKKNTKIIIIRPRLIWGGKRSVASKKLKEALHKKIFFYVGKGDYLKSSTHIYNLYQGINKAIEFGKNKEKYFILDELPVKFKYLTHLILGKKFKAPSLPRWFVYVMCNLADLINYISIKKIRLPLSRSLYFLTFSEVLIDNSQTKKSIHYSPIPLKDLIREHQ